MKPNLVALVYLSLASLMRAEPQGATAEPSVGDLIVAGVELQAMRPPLGFKTYLDLGLLVEETAIARSGVSRAVAARPSERKSALAADGETVCPLFDDGNLLKVSWERASISESAPPSGRTLWCAYSKDGGKSWSERRFLGALMDVRPDAGLTGVIVRKAASRTIQLTFRNNLDRAVDVFFKENSLVRMATKADLQRAEAGRFLLRSVAGDRRLRIADSICVGGDVLFAPAQPPAGYRIGPELGLVLPQAMSGSVLHVAQSGTLYETRAAVTSSGDFLVMIPDGRHAGGSRADANVLLARRSADCGNTWGDSFLLFGNREKHHAALPLVARNGKRLHVFGTQRGEAARVSANGRAFGYRYSDDDGRTWSDVELARLEDGSVFSGTGVIQMTETQAGTWLVGFHHGRILRGALRNGERTWSVTGPLKTAPASPYSLDELRVIALDGANVLAMARSDDGHLWTMRSTDDGRSWSSPQATNLVHPDAPPMLFHLSDGKTLIALLHNRAVPRSVHDAIHSKKWKMPMPTPDQVEAGNRQRHSYQDWVSRAEVWFSLSTDGGHAWSEPRFLFANALAETLPDANPNYQCSYIDLFVDGGVVNLFVPHRWERVVHLRIPEAELRILATRSELADGAAKPHRTR